MNGSEPEINGYVSLWRAIWGFAKLQDEMFYSRLHFVFMQTGEEVYIGRRSLSLKVDLSRWWSLRSHFPFSLATKLKRANEKKSKKLLRQQSMKKIETDIHSVWQNFRRVQFPPSPLLRRKNQFFKFSFSVVIGLASGVRERAMKDFCGVSTTDLGALCVDCVTKKLFPRRV